jgi:DNA/RNA endonuclease YhcR with UshA esterase domain
MVFGCRKGEFDAPPIQGTDPEIATDQIVSLQDVLAKYIVGKFTQVAMDKYLKAVVVADDKSGNFYKKLVVEDENSDLGITLLIDETDIYSQYSQGRRVFIHLKDLTISDYNGLPQLGMGINTSGNSPRLGAIPSSLMSKVLLKGQFNIPVTPRVKKISELNPQDLNTLVTIEGVQFQNTGVTYADNANPSDPKDVNHTINDCLGGSIILRNSGYSDFAGQIIPDKNGNITAIYSVYQNDKQLFIRDLADVAFDKERCAGGGGSGQNINIAELRSLFNGAEVPAPASKVKGIVISDATNKNTDGLNLVLQDATGGIVLRFKSSINIPIDTEVEVDLKGGKINEFKTLLQVQDLTNTSVKVLSQANITPKVITVAQADPKTLESTLVKFDNAELVGSSTFVGSEVKIKDASGEIILFTNNNATFKNQPVKTGKVSVTAIVSEFDGTRQVYIRNLNDIVENGNGCDTNNPALDCDNDGVNNGQDCAPNNGSIFPGKTCDDNNASTVNEAYTSNCECLGIGLNENFSSQESNKDKDIKLGSWMNINVKGDRKWLAKVFSGNTYAQATAYGNTGPVDMESWLVSPIIDTDITSTLSLETALQVYKHDGLTIWATTDFTGDPSTTIWEQVTGLKIAGQGDADHAWIASGDKDLKPFGKKLRLGFKYVGDKNTRTTSYRIDNVSVK